ncbi:MAG TPA: zf-HC2 domain-containing protein [Polyangiaceae bacterium]|nr:zf-HC2 domain-containing protein [Polyangiaceae bacterium]
MAGCTRDWFESVSTWHDGEVTPEDAERIEAHVRSCPECRLDAMRLGRIASALSESVEHEVPDRVSASARALMKRHRRRRWPWAGGAIVAAAALVLVFRFGRASLPEAVAEEIVHRHVAGFARAPQQRFEASNAVTVSDWLSERMGYPVKVRAPANTELVGARVCSLCGSGTAAVMLRRGGTPVTIFIPPPGSEAARAAERLARKGVACTPGPDGNSICACRGAQPMLAVAASAPEQVSAALMAALP